MTGRETLPTTCPLCDHFPLHAQDCTENVSLKKTVQVFLRHAEQQAATNSAADTSQVTNLYLWH